MIHISSGESDAYTIKVEANEPAKIPATASAYVQNLLNSTAATSTVTNHYCGSWCTHGTSFYSDYTYSWPYYTNHYFYQVKCPKKSCKTFNWLELDIIKACINCGSKLQAVSNKADFEIPVTV